MLSFPQENDDNPGLFGSVVILTAAAAGENVKRAIHYNPKEVTVIIEGDDVVSLPRFTDALVVLFGLFYVLHLNYPKELNNTFEFIQKVLLGLDNGRLAPRLLSLKNELFKNLE